MPQAGQLYRERGLFFQVDYIANGCVYLTRWRLYQFDESTEMFKVPLRVWNRQMPATSLVRGPLSQKEVANG